MPSAPRPIFDVAVPIEALPVDVIVDPEGRAFLTIGSEVIAIDARGAVAWRSDFGARVSSTPVVLSDGTALVIVGALAAIVSRTDGRVLREISLPAETYDPLVVDGDLLIHAASPARLVRVDCEGTVVWEVSAGAGDFPSAPVALDATDRAHLLASMPDDPHRSVLLAVERDGTVAYRAELDGYVASGPAMAPSGDVYVGLGRGAELAAFFAAVDRSGALRVDARIAEQSTTINDALAVAEDGTAFLRTWEALVALSPDGVERARTYAHPNLVYAIAIDGAGHVVLTSGSIVLRSPGDLSELGRAEPPDPLFCVGGTALAGGRVLATTCDGRAFGLGE